MIQGGKNCAVVSHATYGDTTNFYISIVHTNKELELLVCKKTEMEIPNNIVKRKWKVFSKRKIILIIR